MRKGGLFWCAVMLVGALTALCFALPAAAQETDGRAEISVDFPDVVFRHYVSEKLDKDHDGYLSYFEALVVTEINVSEVSEDLTPVKDLTGLAFFPNLTVLNCCGTGVSELDVCRNTVLINIDCSGTSISSLKLENNRSLLYLNCSTTRITQLDLRHNTRLATLDCSGTSITSLDLRSNTVLDYLDCSATMITSLDTSACPQLTELYCKKTSG